MPSTWKSYNDGIYGMRQQGKTLQEIADAVGLKSRERIRQILLEHYGNTKIKELLTTRELAKLAQISTHSILLFSRQGVINPANKQQKNYYLWDLNALRILQARRRCKICGCQLPKGKRAYCSDGCSKKGWRLQMKKCQWRRLYRKKGQTLPPSLVPTYPNKSKFGYFISPAQTKPIQSP